MQLWLRAVYVRVLLLFILAPGVVAAAERPAVAILPPVIPFEYSAHAADVEGIADIVQASLARDPRLRWVERAAIRRLIEEQQTMLALGGAESLALGRASGADLLVQPLLSYGKDNWSLRMLVIDPEKADILGAVAANLTGDQKTGPQGLAAPSQDSMARELLDTLVRESGRLAEMRRWIQVGVLFFGNTTVSNDRLDRFASELADALHAAEQPGVRMLRFPAVQAARGEQQLALGAITAGDQRWRELAQWWVWGEFQEVDWEGRAPADGGLAVRITVWDGEHEPVVIEERGRAGDRAALATQVAKRVVAVVAHLPAEGTKPLPPRELATRLVAQADVLNNENIGGEWGVSGAWLNRWRQACHLLDLARFIAPDDRTAALEWLRTRFRRDMTTAVARSSGTQYYDEPEHLWQLRRAEAWGEFVDRFGLEGRWPMQWPKRRNVGDNRTGASSVASMYFRSAMELLKDIPNNDWDRQRSDWPIAGKPLDALRAKWVEETVTRAIEVIDDARIETERHLVADVSHMLSVLTREPHAAKRLLEHVIANAKPAQLKHVAPTLWYKIRQIGTATNDPPWAERMINRLPPIDPASTRPAPPQTFPTATPRKPAPAPSEGIDLGERYHVDVVAIAAWKNVILIAAHGQDLGTPNLDMGNFLFRHEAIEGAGRKLGRLEKELDLPGGVTAMAQRDSIVWMSSGGNGIARYDLATSRWKRWGLDGGLPVQKFADIDVDPDGLPVAVSGESVSPPVVTCREGEKWISRTVETFYGAGETHKPFAEVVAVTRRAVVVAGDHHGIRPFASLWLREQQKWVDVRKPLLRHVAEQKLDVGRVEFGEERFNAIDVVARADGGFILLHPLGATWMDDAGMMLRTSPWGERRQMTEIGQGLLSRDGKRLWIVGTADKRDSILVELAPAPGATPRLHQLPAGSRPLRLADGEEQLLIGCMSGDKEILFLSPREGFIGR